MWTMEDVLSELSDGNNNNNNNEGNGLPPGFRFHPTDEELITFYLVSKVFYESNNNIATPVRIAEVDLNRCEPWDLPERAKMGEKEWYLYSLRDRKYPTGLRTNRATGTGYWKATGKDRQVHATSISTTPGVSAGHGGCGSGVLIGMKKTLVFYQGRAPRGVKTRWVMHEYRLDGHFSTFRLSSKEEWVICRIFYKHGGEKKTSYHPQAPPLSPLLRCLPPLMDAHPNPSSSATTAVNDNASTPHSQNHDTNFLLQSLLSNTHNSFPTMTQPNTSFTTNASTLTAAAAAAAAPSAFLLKSFNHLPSLTSSSAVSSSIYVPKHCIDNHQYQHWFDKISQIIPSETHYSFDEMDVHPNGYTTAADVDMSSSVFALDRLLHPHINLPAESRPLHP